MNGECSRFTGGVRRSLLLAVSVAMLVPIVAKGPKVIELSKFPRVAVLVCRMANPSGLLSPITAETDYNIEAPDKKHDVCGENEARLKSAFPGFPVKTSSHVPKMENEFCGNLTEPITRTVSTMLEGKGRAIVYVRSLAPSWPQPLDQMKVGGILAALSGKADALLVVHYMDQGNAIYDSVKVRRVDHGFSGFICKLALFEVAGAKPVGEAETWINPMALAANDSGLSAGAPWKEKIKVIDGAKKDTAFQRGFSITERQGLLFSTTTVTTFDATDEEMVGLAMHYLVDGLHGKSYLIDVSGLKELLR